MFRATRTQSSLLELQWLLPPKKRDRLQNSWGQAFRTNILPLIDEEPFRPFFAENKGQPNKSIRLLVGLHLLKEQYDLTDEQVIESLEFNLIWQHAFGVEPEEAHVCQKTLHNFRTLVVKEKLGLKLFVDTTKEIAKAAGVSFARQRHDSTHVVSNMATLSRLGILVETTAVFLKQLKQRQQERFDALPPGYAKRYLDREGYFADAKKEQARRRLPVAAQDLFRLVQRFESDELVAAMPSFAMMCRVLEEQCKVVEAPPDDAIVMEEACEPTCATAGAAQEAAPEGQPTPAEHVATPASASEERAVAVAASQPTATKVPCASAGVTPSTEPTGTAAAEQPEQSPRDDMVAAPVRPESSLESPCAAKGEAPDAEPSTTEAPDAIAEAKPGGGADVIAAAAVALLVTIAGAGDAEGAQDGENRTDVVLRVPKEISSDSLQSPYDPDATYGHKGKGYEVQLSETCVKENPFQLVTSVSVNGAHESDQHALIPTLDGLAKNGMAPDAMIADTGYGSGANIVAAAQRGTELIAPVHGSSQGNKNDKRWDKPAEPPTHELPPATPASQPPSVSAIDTPQPVSPEQEQPAAKLTLADFQFSQDFSVLESCPAGNQPSGHLFAESKINAQFSPSDCEGCPLADKCPSRRLASGGRQLGCLSTEAATAHRQREQHSDEFKKAYKIRSGIESTNSQIKGAQGADDLRVRGKERVEFVMMFKALSLNVFRYVWHVVDQFHDADPHNTQEVMVRA